ncbi:MAG: sulfatase-like hydrolase/transferase, partial [Wohlfahrtiimonas sp.]
MKKWCWLWLIATLIDAGIVIFQAVSASGAQPDIIPFDFSKTLDNIPYWLDSIWYVFNIIAINVVFAFFGYLLFKNLKCHWKQLPNISLLVFLYLTFGALMVLAKERFNIIYPSYLYHPFNIESVEESLWMVSVVILGVSALGYVFLNLRYWKSFILLYTVLAGLSYYPYIWGVLTSAKDVKNLEKPNVIYILLDAVRPDHMKAGGAPFDIMPKLNKMIEEQGVFYKDVTVSVGRSFPSAVAILSGLHAINNGARDNLFAKEGITYDKTIAHVLKNEGYQTIAANDAVQFWNLDQDYGFDAMWTAGQSSLKLIPLDVGGFMPLPLLFANTRIGELFFPYSYSDRNIDDLYDTGTYVNKIERNLNLLDKDRPLFLFMSMELTHTPYADETPHAKSVLKDLQGTDYYDACNYFLASMNVLDDQLFDILDVLKQSGRLDNTVLIIGSDHGQGFWMEKDMYITYDGKPFEILEGFYGNNAINPSSTSLMLSVFSFLPNKQLQVGIRENQVESIDIMPTI